MKVLDIGHQYELDNFEKDGSPNQTLQFIKKTLKDVEPATSDGTMITVANGTTNEEVLKVLIDRLYSLQSKFSCRENSIAITKLEEALMWLNKRTQDRVNRGVEGKHTK